MTKFTNKHNLPTPLFRALSSNKYTRGDARMSITTLLGSPRVAVLKEKHGQDIEVDVIDRLWAVFGTTVHTMLEEGSEGLDDYIAEERIFTEMDGWKISGGIDVQHFDNNLVGIRDWKVTSAYAVMNGKADWEKQLNAYAYLVEKEKGFKVRDIQIGAIIRDWKRFEAERNPAYPQTPVVMLTIPLWGQATREKYLKDRVALHKEAVRLAEWDEPLPPCTPEEMWEKPSVWAVKKVGGKRASSIHTDQRAAVKKAIDTGCVVEARPGERTKCMSFCEVSQWCDIHQEYLKAQAPFVPEA
jgi:hypothetical protein